VRFVFPPEVRAGDSIAVVAPSSPFAREEFWRGLAWLRDRYRIVASSGVLARSAYLAGDDQRRARELAAAMTNPEVRAIVVARGGYGATRIVAELPWDAFAASPKWIVGFSDVTALHLEACARGVASVHSPHVTGLGRDATPWMRACFLASIERPRATRIWDALKVVRGGEARGPIVGGNLALVEAMASARRLAIPDGAIVVLEDVTERPYRIDRMLTSLRLGGHFSRASALVFGEFAECDPGADGRTVAEVIEERTRDLGVPVVTGAPFGHGARNDAFVLGADAALCDGTLAIG
jgi:muramoyltetrapeptide carboxypeptidase